MKLYRRFHIVLSCLSLILYISDIVSNRRESWGRVYENKQVMTSDGTVKSVPPVKRGSLDQKQQDAPAQGKERIEYKRNLAQRLVNDAANYFLRDDVSYAEGIRAFSADAQWQYDEMRPFVIYENGTIYGHGEETGLIWSNIDEARKERKRASPVQLQDKLIPEMRKAAQQDGWLSYEWNFEIKHVYVQQVEKNEYIYFIGTGFYPESHEFAIKQLVNKAITYAQEYGSQELFQRINNPIGAFVEGPLYLWVYDFDGNCFAHGRNIGFVGRNRLEWQDARGNYRNKQIIQSLQDKESMWIEYYESGDVLKRAYVHRFKDPEDGKQYFIGGGYYPEVDMPRVKDFVRQAVDYLKANGPKIAFRDFTGYGGGFRPGPLRIFVYSLDGTILADGENPEFVGQNRLSVSEQDNRSAAQRIINQAKEFGQGRITLYEKGEYKEVYFQKVEVPSGAYIVGSGFWPDNKKTVAESLAEKAATTFKKADYEKTIRAFTSLSPDYIRGDLYVEVIDYNGIIVAYGPDRYRVWDRMDQRTEKGDTVSDLYITTAQTGGGWISYRIDGQLYRSYVTEVAREVKGQGGTQINRYALAVSYV